MSRTDEVVAGVRRMITDGELGPGDRLPVEKDLAERLGVSRGSLREGVRALTVLGVLDTRQGDGTYVTSLEPRLLLEAMSFVVDLHQDDSILEIFAVRRMLEPGATALVAREGSDEQIARIAELVDELGSDPGIEDLVAHDIAFHNRIAGATGNAYLASLLESLSSRTVRARVWRGITEGGSVARTIGEHRAIVDALRRRDPELAAALMVAHVAGVEEWLRRAR